LLAEPGLFSGAIFSATAARASSGSVTCESCASPCGSLPGQPETADGSSE
jgi:hypothetical protein